MNPHGTPENLVHFPPGVSGNPNGRPKGRSITARLRELLEATELGGKPLKGGKQVADLVAEALLKNAIKGDVRHLQELINRVEGKVPDKHVVTGADGGPVEITATVREAAAMELDTWRKEMRDRLGSWPSAAPTAPTSSTNSW